LDVHFAVHTHTNTSSIRGEIRTIPLRSARGDQLSAYDQIGYRKVFELGTHLDLMLNLDEPEQKALWDLADRMFRTKDKVERVRMDSELMVAGRVVLKKEGLKIKLEQQGMSQ
jgi:hypothetical protein